MRQRLVFEVADRQLDDGVVAVLCLDDLKRFGAVCQKREVAPVRPQLEDVSLAVELRDGDRVSELSQVGVAATSGAAVAVV